MHAFGSSVYPLWTWTFPSDNQMFLVRQKEWGTWATAAVPCVLPEYQACPCLTQGHLPNRNIGCGSPPAKKRSLLMTIPSADMAQGRRYLFVIWFWNGTQLCPNAQMPSCIINFTPLFLFLCNASGLFAADLRICQIRQEIHNTTLFVTLAPWHDKSPYWVKMSKGCTLCVPEFISTPWTGFTDWGKNKLWPSNVGLCLPMMRWPWTNNAQQRISNQPQPRSLPK